MTVGCTLCCLRKNGKILLQMKTPGLFGGGKWNGPGGKIKQKERPEKAAEREVFEETGLKIRNLKRHGILEFYNNNKKKPDIKVYVFSTSSFSGKIRHSKEGLLRWFPESIIPYEKMWEDDRFWFPLLLQEKKFTGRFWFQRDFKNLVRKEICEIS